MKVNLTIGIPAWLDKICTWPMMVYRKWKYGEAFRRIYLGEGKWTILDRSDYYRFGNFKWIVYGTGYNLYAIRHKMVAADKTETVYMHREITNPPVERFVDHKNCDGLDNRRSNLRFATHAQNMCNCRKRKNATSKFRGVWFYKGKWKSQIKGQGKRIFLGRFDSEIEAAKAYDAAARKYQREFARLNFPEDKPVAVKNRQSKIIRRRRDLSAVGVAESQIANSANPKYLIRVPKYATHTTHNGNLRL